MRGSENWTEIVITYPTESIGCMTSGWMYIPRNTYFKSYDLCQNISIQHISVCTSSELSALMGCLSTYIFFKTNKLKGFEKQRKFSALLLSAEREFCFFFLLTLYSNAV